MTPGLPISLGVDIGGTHTKLLALDAAGRRSELVVFDTPTDQDERVFLATCARHAHALLETFATNSDNGTMTCCGIGAPNASVVRGMVETPPNLTSWSSSVPLAKLFEDEFGVPAALINDASAAAFAEWRHGSGKGVDDLITVTLGTGVGGGFVIGGRLHHGPRGVAGELGHLCMDPHSERRCGCGLLGCLETFASVPGFERTFKELTNRTLDAPSISNAARNSDADAIETFHTTAEILGRALAGAVNITGAERVIIGGGLSNAGDLLMNPLREALESRLFTTLRGTVELRLAGCGYAAGALGAAAYALDSIDS